MATMGSYDQIRLLDKSGRELLRVDDDDGVPRIIPREELRQMGGRECFRNTLALEPGEVHVSPLEREQENGVPPQSARPVVRVGTLLPAGAGADPDVLILSGLSADLLKRLDAIAGQYPGRTMLVNGSGMMFHSTFATHESASKAGTPLADSETHPGQIAPERWAQLQNGARGQAMDDAGLFTFTTIQLGGSNVDNGPRQGNLNRLTIAAQISSSTIRRRVEAGYRTHLWAGLAGVFLIFVLAYSLANAQSLRATHQRTLTRSEGRLRTLSTQLLLAQERERGRIARDLHDEVGQMGTAVHLHLQRATNTASTEKKDEFIARANDSVQGLLRWARDMAVRLRPAMLDDLGLKEAVLSLLQQFEDTTGMTTVAQISTGELPLPVQVTDQAYRIIQESLTNVVKHARATEVEVRIGKVADSLHMEVRDNGVGFDPELDHCGGQEGFGIQGMKERVELLGGRFDLRSGLGRPTVVDVILPLKPTDVST